MHKKRPTTRFLANRIAGLLLIQLLLGVLQERQYNFGVELIALGTELRASFSSFSNGFDAEQADAVQFWFTYFLRCKEQSFFRNECGWLTRVCAVDVEHVPRTGECEMDQRLCRRFCDALDTFNRVVEEIAENCAKVRDCDPNDQE